MEERKRDIGTMRRHLWIGGLVLGLALLAAGALFVALGLEARATIRDGLAEERAVTSTDAAIPGVPVVDARTAEMQAEVIKEHTLGRFGPYSEMEREDPNRDTYLNGLTLRNGLNLGVLAFGVANLAIASGAVIILLGAGTLGVGVPALYWLRRPEAGPAPEPVRPRALAPRAV